MVDVGTRISNTISDGDGESDLYLTFTFVWNYPNIKPGSKEEAEKKSQFAGQAREAVLTSIKQIRDLVQKGVVKV
jgi:hypothetical protein